MKVFRSIRWQFQLWYGFFLVLILTGFGVTAFQLQSAQLTRQVDVELQRRLSIVAGVAGLGRPPMPPPRPGGPPPPARLVRLSANDAALFGEQTAGEFYYAVWLRNGPPLTLSATAPDDVPMPKPADVAPRQRGPWREVFLFPAPFDCVLVGCSTEASQAGLNRLRWELAGVGSAVLVLGLLGGWWLATHALRPLAEISAVATEIAGGHLSERIPTETLGSELAELAQVLNSTFARLEAVFAQQTRFTSDAAHELRTPLTVLLMEAQSALQRERSPEEYRAALTICQRAGQRMRRLIESLLQLARLDAERQVTAPVRFDLSAVCEECVELLRPLAAEREIILSGRLPPTECLGDPDRLSQVVINLVSNAIQHNRPGDEVTVSVLRENGSVLLVVTDNGRGIPSEKLPLVFERFYRAESSRTRRTGSGGLGLAIVRSIVRAHRGQIEATSQVEQGTSITVRLPGDGGRVWE